MSAAPVPAATSRSSPADLVSTPVDGVEVVASLSPSRASDFMTCPLRYRFRTVDGLPQEPTREAVRGTLVHKVLERLFDLPALDRTPVQAAKLLEPAWREVLAVEPGLSGLFDSAVGAHDFHAWLATCASVLEGYFELEDPQRLEPAEREYYVETRLDSGLLLRGFVDRLDVAPDGAIRVVDYKTGRSPSPMHEAAALFQMRFYALVIWRTRGVLPAMLQLVYLGDREVLRHCPDEAELLATERKVEALWRAIRLAEESGEWQPSPGRLCSWCSYQDMCPAFGGTPPAPTAPA
ncbi:RecB family exonuclease [Nocardioides houyundeii]|uniref:RecB family exonuclease n=1 Tax=Nocardioides houyundeii TaxID=2045452 RepID=UPI000DF354B8|nr:PD-(D/E)XK nuclease family protein [Nocardioides houyundeii]